uniref:Gag protein n=1 Tax=Bombyx mori TaxID=7091 RepID=O01418_BOMMO|nr:Gag protein [Bombyx mori]
MSSYKEELPQEGTSRSAGGESLRAAERSAARCPSSSGGGNNCSKRSVKDGGRVSAKDGENKERRGGSVKDNEAANVLSDDSMATASSSRSSLTGSRRKRLKGSSTECSESSSGEETACSARRAASKTPSKRGRGRPPTTGQYVGLAAAKEAYVKAQREELALREREVTESVRKLRVREDAVAGSTGEPALDPERRLDESAKLAVAIAAKSGNLKGTYVRALKEMAAAIREAKEDMAARTTDGETKRLQELCRRQEAEILHLKNAIADMRSEMARLAQAVGSPAAVPAPVPAPAPIQRSDDEEERRLQRIMRAVGTMLDARLSGLEARLPPEPRMRPPLAADHRRSRGQEKTPTPPTAAESMPTPGPTAAVATAAPNGGGPQKKKAPKSRQQPAQPEPRTFPPAPAALTEAWTTVARRGAKPRTATATGTVSAPPPLKEKKKRLRPPRSQAVIVKLQPEAVERGVTYRAVLAEARAKIDTAELGIPIQRIRSAVTGAKVLVVDGADQNEKADLLAEKLREVLPSDSIVVSRPTITAAVRLSGLDESISREELVAEVARIGECPPDIVKVGEIKMGPGGTGQVLVRCPIAGVKKILAVNKLRIGWSVLRVQLLEARRLQCYRCHALGHVSARCPSSVDRSGECYRCGQTGHKSAGCALTPHCTICAGAGRPAAHVSGGKACAKPPKQRQQRSSAAEEKRRSQPGTATATPMDDE